jgi:beta-glucosidase
MKIKTMTMMCTTALFMGCSAHDLAQQVDELYGKMTQEERIARLISMYMEVLFDE